MYICTIAFIVVHTLVVALFSFFFTYDFFIFDKLSFRKECIIVEYPTTLVYLFRNNVSGLTEKGKQIHGAFKNYTFTYNHNV